MIVGIGNDVCEISRIDKILKKYDVKFKNRCFTFKEIDRCNKRYNSSSCYAKRFAAKEACSKALGTGIKFGVFWKDIEIENLKTGKPIITLKGKAKIRMDNLIPPKMVANITVTISDDANIAQALVIIEALNSS